MNEMTIWIVDRFALTKDNKINENAKVKSYRGSIIPRVGEKVVWYYEPTPTVKSVMYDFENKAVYVVVD
jgi:hypothetical protein